MKITKEWLKEQIACEDGTRWFLNQSASRLDTVVMKLTKENHYDWANWVLMRSMTYAQRVRYAIFAAEQVLAIFEKAYPNDKRPREAIEAARRFVDQTTEENRDAAYEAAYAASNAASNAAASAAACAAACAAAYAAYAAASATCAAASAAANAACEAAYAAMKRKIVVYGLKLVAGERGIA